MLEIKGIVKRKQDERAEGFRKIKEGLGADGAETIRIRSLSDKELIDDLQKRKLSAQSVLEAYMIKVKITTICHF